MILLGFQGRARLKHQPFHITFCFDRRVVNLAALTEQKGIKPSAPHPLTAKAGSRAHTLTKQREAGLGLSTAEA